ncbi:TIM barrel protein [Enterobacteriaceae bacterium BIT-l23]|uniref:sugar phosphate isomerase/epimerase family protein n=1 Tax=Jejubacter sp. L23 TaxID=3092086 RepID=UPI001585C2D5|nr:TIM barrel protein [Enterobacteriaceae bacterium BIT-l23]
MMSGSSARLVPSAHIAELFFPLMASETRVVETVRRIAGFGYYRAVETGIITGSREREALRERVASTPLILTQWLTFALLNEQLNLSSLDPALRRKSVARARELAHLAAECGTRKLSLVSGADPGEARRDEALAAFGDSLVALGETVSQYPDMILQLEPLDRFAHKRQLIGFSDETARWMQALRPDCPKLYIAWDSAHVALNQEALATSLRQCAPLMSQLHLSNAILDPAQPGYGDYHMKFGAPGFLTAEVAREIITVARSLELPPELDEITIAIEMRTTEQDDLWANERECREFLQAAMA